MPKTTKYSLTVGTSIVPARRIKIQQEAIATWQDAGLSVVSFNNTEEVSLLERDFPDVMFIQVHRTGDYFTGRPVIFISDILQNFAQRDDVVFGIINSDIYLDNFDSLASFLHKNAKNSFVYGPRLEVRSLNDKSGSIDPFGFDYFFFDRKFLHIWGEEKFCLGMPFWDHWFPLAPLLAGYSVKLLAEPIGRHISHPTDRDDSFFIFNDLFVQFIIHNMDQEAATKHSASSNKEISRLDLPDLATNYKRLKQNAQNAEANNLNPSEIREQYEKLAVFFDSITQKVILFLKEYSQSISFK